MTTFWLKITCLFVSALAAGAILIQWKTGELVGGVFDLFATQHPSARRPLIWITNVIFAASIAFLLYATMNL
jgi:hypothetical protein